MTHHELLEIVEAAEKAIQAMVAASSREDRAGAFTPRPTPLAYLAQEIRDRLGDEKPEPFKPSLITSRDHLTLVAAELNLGHTPEQLDEMWKNLGAKP